MHKALIALALAPVLLAACTPAALDLISARMEIVNCYVGDALIGADPCAEEPTSPPPPESPLYCYQTLAGVECYADRVTFGPEPAWIRAAPPDVGE